MNIFMKPSNFMKQLVRKPCDFIKDSKGVAAVEFALIAPLLLLLFVGTVEISFLVAVDRKLSRTSSAIADLVTQEANPSAADLDVYLGITDRVMYPYVDRTPCVVITSVRMELQDDNNNGTQDPGEEVLATVVASVDNKSGSDQYKAPQQGQCDRSSSNLQDTQNARQQRNVGDQFPVPDSIKIDGSDLIVAEVEYDHRPIVGFISAQGVSGIEIDSASVVLGDRIFLRPRQGSTNLPGS